MNSISLPLQRQYANRIVTTEWTHQLNAIAQSVSFFEDYFAWTKQNADKVEPLGSDADENADFYTTEATLVVEEAREALRILKLLCQELPRH